MTCAFHFVNIFFRRPPAPSCSSRYSLYASRRSSGVSGPSCLATSRAGIEERCESATAQRQSRKRCSAVGHRRLVAERGDAGCPEAQWRQGQVECRDVPFSTTSPTKTLANPRTTVRMFGPTDCCRT